MGIFYYCVYWLLLVDKKNLILFCILWIIFNRWYFVFWDLFKFCYMKVYCILNKWLCYIYKIFVKIRLLKKIRWKRVNIKFMKMNIWRGLFIRGKKRIDIMIKISMLYDFLFLKKWWIGKFFIIIYCVLEELNLFVWFLKKLGFFI